MATWTPSLSGVQGADGIAPQTAAYATLKITIDAGNPMIGGQLQSVSFNWESQSASPGTSNWDIKHFDSGGVQKGSTQTTIATPPATGTGFVDQTTLLSKRWGR